MGKSVFRDGLVLLFIARRTRCRNHNKTVTEDKPNRRAPISGNPNLPGLMGKSDDGRPESSRTQQPDRYSIVTFGKMRSVIKLQQNSVRS